MIDAIDSLLDKMDVVLGFFTDSFYYFLIFAGISTALMVVCVGFIINSVGRFRRSMAVQKEEVQLLKAMVAEQRKLNQRLIALLGKEGEAILEGEDDPGDRPQLKDFY